MHAHINPHVVVVVFLGNFSANRGGRCMGLAGNRKENRKEAKASAQLASALFHSIRWLLMPLIRPKDMSCSSASCSHNLSVQSATCRSATDAHSSTPLPAGTGRDGTGAPIPYHTIPIESQMHQPRHGMTDPYTRSRVAHAAQNRC